MLTGVDRYRQPIESPEQEVKKEFSVVIALSAGCSISCTYYSL